VLLNISLFTYSTKAFCFIIIYIEAAVKIIAIDLQTSECKYLHTLATQMSSGSGSFATLIFNYENKRP